MTAPQAGWYPDPQEGPLTERFWDGTAWTERKRPGRDEQTAAAARQTSAATHAEPVQRGTATPPSRTGPIGAGAWQTTAATHADPVHDVSAQANRSTRDRPTLSSALAIVSLVAGIISVSLFWFYAIGGLFGLMAIVGAYFALREPDQTGEAQKAFAVGAVVTGGLGVGLAIALLLFGQVASNAIDDVFSDVESDLDSQLDTDPSDGECDFERILQDPDC